VVSVRTTTSPVLIPTRASSGVALSRFDKYAPVGVRQNASEWPAKPLENAFGQRHPSFEDRCELVLAGLCQYGTS
jgi:hypothetical protein